MSHQAPIYVDRMLLRLGVPSTASELSEYLDVPISSIRARLYQLKKSCRVQRLTRVVHVDSKRGRPYEYLWVRA